MPDKHSALHTGHTMTGARERARWLPTTFEAAEKKTAQAIQGELKARIAKGRKPTPTPAQSFYPWASGS